jgi:DNA replication protein
VSAARPFRGFPAGARMAAVPALFFSDLLAAIEDPAELYVTLHVFAALARPGARGRRVSGEMLAADPALARALARLPGGCGAALRRGLDLAVARGTLLRLTV